MKIENDGVKTEQKEIVFFIDKQQFKTEKTELTVKVLLEAYAKEDSSQTSLVLKHGNDTTKFTNLEQVIELKNGMQFLVYHNAPTTVSAVYGPERMKDELRQLGFTNTDLIKDDKGNTFTIIPDYEILLGRFAGRVIDLALPAPADFPRSVGSSIHVKADPQLLEKKDTIPGVRNIIDSSLGPAWRYWSKNFGWAGERSARRLISQINEVFKNG